MSLIVFFFVCGWTTSFALNQIDEQCAKWKQLEALASSLGVASSLPASPASCAAPQSCDEGGSCQSDPANAGEPLHTVDDRTLAQLDDANEEHEESGDDENDQVEIDVPCCFLF